MTVRFRSPLTPSRLVIHSDPQQAELPAPSELNYDSQPPRIARLFRPGLSHNAGFSQWGMPQSFHTAYLPPPVRVGVIQRYRSIGGAYGFGTPSAPTQHVPAILVPRTVG